MSSVDNLPAQGYHKKTILQVIPALMSGGVERGTIELARRLLASEYTPIVISSGGVLVEHLRTLGVLHIKLDVATKNPFKIWQNARVIAQIIKDYQVDIIHARSRAPAWSCYMAAKATGIKFITTFHGIYNISSIIKRYYNSIMTEGEKIIAVSDFVKKHIVDNYNTNPDKIVVIHRGVDHKYFDPAVISPETTAKLRDKYHILPETPVLLLPSRFTEWKGHMVLVEAINRIKHLNFYCLMVGENAKHPAFIQRIKDKIVDLKLQSKIQLFGNESDMQGLYSISDIVLSTSIEPEAFGRTIIEGQAMKKLVIASNIGGAAETIVDQVTGYHVPPQNAEILAEKIAHCLSIFGTPEAQKVQEAARESAIRNFAVDGMFDKTMAVYRQLV